MATIRELLGRILGTLQRGRSDADLDAELRAHLEFAAEEESRNQAISPEEARRLAAVMLGSPTHAMEGLRDQRGLPWLEDVGQDLRFGLRGVARNPVFAAVIVISLALGIGANAALFSLIEATLVRDLPVDAPQELVFLQWRAQNWTPDYDRFAGTGSVSRVYRSPTFSNAAVSALQAQNQTLSDIFAFNLVTNVTAVSDGQADPATMQLVSGSFFTGLHVSAAIGRSLAASDDRPSADPVVVMSDTYWSRRFGRNPSAVGARVMLDGAAFTIVGVAPRAFRGAVALAAERPDFWIPMAFAPRFGPRYTEPGFWWLSVMGRLRTGATPDQVRGNLEGTFRAAVVTTETIKSKSVLELHALSARRGAVDEGPQDELEHAVILGAVFGLLLLIVCLNVVNLVLSRSAARRTEIGVRLALGAGRGRLIRQLLTENMMLAGFGGLLGVVLAGWGRALFATSGWVPADLELRLSPSVLGLTTLVSTAAGLLCGLVPAFRATRTPVGATVERPELRAESRSRGSKGLLVVQVAASVVLLFGAGLFVRTLGRWNNLETGFDTDNLLIFQIRPAVLGYEPERAALLRERLVDRIRAVPGVIAATSSGVFWRRSWFGRFLIDGEPRRPIPSSLPVRHNFFETLRLPLVAGRLFLPEEDQRLADTAIIDENFAREFFGPSSPLGRRIAFQPGGRELEIVGVVGNMWLPGTRPEGIMPAVYLPERTRAADFDPKADRMRANYRGADITSIEIRTASDPLIILPSIRRAVGEIDSNLPLEDPKTFAQGTREVLAPTRIVSLIWLSFGGVALVLTAIGLYGVLAVGVAQRTREIGIRTALGARRLDIVRLVTGQMLGLVSLGLAVGLASALAVNQFARAHIFGVTFYDPATLAAVLLILVAVTSLAALIPVRRALRLDPTVALRSE